MAKKDIWSVQGFKVQICGLGFGLESNRLIWYLVQSAGKK